MTDRIYAVGDIHGELDHLKNAVSLIGQDGGPNARIVLLGDYVDRGPDSRGVLQFLSDGLAQAKDWICLLGNHDRMFRMFLENYPRQDSQLLVGYHWLHDRVGGLRALSSYGVELGENERIYKLHARVHDAVPEAHRTFLNGLKYHHLENGILFVHAGLKPGIALENQDESDLIWIRKEFHEFTDPHPWLVVHGHTPVDQATHYGNRINLDSGCGYGRDVSVAM